MYMQCSSVKRVNCANTNCLVHAFKGYSCASLISDVQEVTRRKRGRTGIAYLETKMTIWRIRRQQPKQLSIKFLHHFHTCMHAYI